MSQNKNYTKSELFTVMNRIRKERKVSMKEAYAAAIAELESKNQNPAPAAETLYEQFKRRAMKGNVKVRYESRRGKIITTTVTLCQENIPTDRNFPVQGRRKPKYEGDIIVFDVRHGVRRPMPIGGLLEVYPEATKAGKRVG